MNFEINIDSRIINVSIINKTNIKHCYLRLLNKDNIEIKANIFFTLDDAKKLISKKHKWLVKGLNKFNSSSLKNNQFYFLGNIEDIFEDDFDLIAYYKNTALEIMPELVEKHSKRMSLYPSDLKFRNNKSRWGSCSYKNSIILNINLMKFPLSVIEYVIIHELAHIKHKNHSKKFWNFVQEYCPSYKEEEILLKSFL